MKTNVKNGLIYLGEIATDTATIRIGDVISTQFDFEWVTNADGFYPIFGETNENGVIERLIIDVNPLELDIVENNGFMKIDPEDVIDETIEGAGQ